MALTGWSTSNYLVRDTGVWPGQRPFGISAWKRLGTAGILAAVGTAGSSVNRRWIFGSDGSAASASEADGSSGAIATSTANVPADTWANVFGTFITGTSREVYLDGANKGTNSTSKTVTNPNRTTIGIRPDITDPFTNTAAIAEVSIWDLANMSEANRDSLAAKLAAGENPINIRNEFGQVWSDMLIAYWSLETTSNITDRAGNGHDLTMQGTLTAFANHPTIDAITSSLEVKRRNALWL